jgi:hypothetical protein
MSSIIVLLIIVVAFRQNLKFEAPYPDITATADSAMIARGKYLAYGPAHCANCHGKPGSDSFINKGIEVPLSGGNVFPLPVGNFYVHNLSHKHAISFPRIPPNLRLCSKTP